MCPGASVHLRNGKEVMDGYKVTQLLEAEKVNSKFSVLSTRPGAWALPREASHRCAAVTSFCK